MTWDVLLVLLNPRETLRLTGLEHGRAIPLAVNVQPAFAGTSRNGSGISLGCHLRRLSLFGQTELG